MLVVNFSQGLALGNFFVIGIYIDQIIMKCNKIPYIPDWMSAKRLQTPLNDIGHEHAHDISMHDMIDKN